MDVPLTGNFAVIRRSKLKHFGAVAASLDHNFRTRETLNADPSREHLNVHSLPDPESVMKALKARLPSKLRRDAVVCLEYCITASHDSVVFRDNTWSQYFTDALEWVKAEHGEDNVIGWSWHLDELTPHLIIYALPMTDRGTLSAKEYMGGRRDLEKFQERFHKEVASKYGLERGLMGTGAKHTTVQQWYAWIQSDIKPLSIDAFDVTPRLIDAATGRTETPDQVAARLTEDLNEMLAPVIAKAKLMEAKVKEAEEARRMADVWCRKYREAQDERDAAKAEAKRIRLLYDCLHHEQRHKAIQDAKANAPAYDRAQAILNGAHARRQGPVARFTQKALSALHAVKNASWSLVDWLGLEREFVQEEMRITNEWRAVKTIMEFSPGQAHTSTQAAEAAVLAAKARDAERERQKREAEKAAKAAAREIARQERERLRALEREANPPRPRGRPRKDAAPVDKGTYPFTDVSSPPASKRCRERLT